MKTTIERSSQTHNEGEIDLREILKALFHYKWSIMFITFLTLYMAAFFLYFKPDIYSFHALEVDFKR